MIQVKAKAIQAFQEYQNDLTEREAITDKNDRCRLIHLLGSASLMHVWQEAYTPLDRADLDAKKQDDAFSRLVDAFSMSSKN